MSKLIIKTEGNSLDVNGTIYQKGKLHFTECENGIIFGNTRCDYTDVTCNGTVLGSPAELYTWLKQNVFNDGGGSGTGAVNSVTGTLVTGTTENPIVDNPLLEMHRVLLTDGGNRTITDFGGTITIVKNGLEQVDAFTLTWGDLTTETAKLTVIFTFDCVVNNVANSGVTINRLPISVKQDDVWTVVYDKFFNEWNLASLNTSAGIPTGTDRDVLSWDANGALKADRITAWQLTDINGRPSFPFGVLAGASLQDEKPLLMFTEASTVAKSGTLPIYTTAGRLKVSNAVAQDEAVTLSQVNSRTPLLGASEFMVGSSNGNVARKINRDDFNMGLGRVLTTNAAGNFTGLPYSNAPLADTFAQRDVLGRMLIKDGEGDDHAVTLKQLNSVANLIDSAVPKSGQTKDVLCSDGKGNNKWDVDTKYSAILGATKRPKSVHYATVNIATGMTTSSSRFLVSYDMSSIGNNIDDIYVSYNVVKAGADTQSILHPVLRQVNTAGRNLIFDLYKFTNTGQLTVGSIYDAEGAKLFIEIVDKGVSTV